MTSLLDLAAAQLASAGPHASRRACWLARSAMEEQLDRLLEARGVDPGPRASTRSRLSCLEAAYEDEPGLAARAQYVWSRLSEACHQHAYALAPTYDEARSLVSAVATLQSAPSIPRSSP